MNQGKYVFAQLAEFLPQRVFDSIIKKCDGDKYLRYFYSWEQLLCMLFGQLTNLDSLRDLIVTMEAHSKKSSHLGLGKSITRSNLAKTNGSCNSRIFEEFDYHLISMARNKRANEDFEIKGKVYAFDSTTIDLYLNVFWWARFQD